MVRSARLGGILLILLLGCDAEQNGDEKEPLGSAGGVGGAGGLGGAGGTEVAGAAGTAGRSNPTGGSAGVTGMIVDAGNGGSPSIGDAGSTGGFTFSPKLPPDQCDDPTQPSPEEVQAAVDAVSDETPATLAANHAVSFDAELGYAPLDAAGLELIQGSALGLTDVELTHLSDNGFVLSERQRFPTFFYGYRTLYAEDLPLYITVDSILHAVHRSYDDILASIEYSVLEAHLERLLDGLRTNLASSTLPTETRADLDVYLAVARSLLGGGEVPPVAGGSSGDISAMYSLAVSAQGLGTLTLFGSTRDEDLSQFTPRGHYTMELQNYFRAMMWLGRVDLRLIQTDTGGGQTVQRRQVAAALALRELMGPELQGIWDVIDGALRRFVGEVDSMTPPQVDALRADLGITSVTELDGIDDATLANAILSSPYGMQRIASHLMVIGATGTLPLNRSFTLLGQRYTWLHRTSSV